MTESKKPLIIKKISLISEAFKGCSKTHFVPFKSSVAGHKPAGWVRFPHAPANKINELSYNSGFLGLIKKYIEIKI
jgi:hypothetical protein